MKELIDKLLRFDEFFIFLMPGIVLMGSLLLWIDVDSSNPIWNQILSNQFLLIFVLFVGSSLFSLVSQSFLTRIPRRHTRPLGYPSEDEYRFEREKLEALVPPVGILGLRRLFQSRKEERENLLTNIAEEAHLSFLMSYGLSLALLAVGIQTTLRLVLLIIDRATGPTSIVKALPHLGAPALIVLTVIALVGYVLLHRRAVRDWRLEACLTEWLDQSESRN